jgi:hypothetical protein
MIGTNLPPGLQIARIVLWRDDTHRDWRLAYDEREGEGPWVRRWLPVPLNLATALLADDEAAQWYIAGARAQREAAA